MHPEKYTLTWHTYSDHLKNMMKELMMNEGFSDVTLVTEDKKQIKAHTNILSACSPVFKDILKKDRNSSSIMYLRGIQYSELESIIQFIYLGEATFYEERMDEFLTVAKSLEIKELCNAEAESFNEETEHYPPHNDQDTSTEFREEHIVLSEKQAPQLKEGSVRVTGNYVCDHCDKTYSTKMGLHYHNKTVHQGVKYSCDQCDYQASQQSNLTVHIQSKHEGIKYACDQCDHQAKNQSNLIQHIQAKHEGIRYACDQCDYQATTNCNLVTHIQSKHEGIKYACDQCNYQAKWKRDLTRHKRSKHEPCL